MTPSTAPAVPPAVSVVMAAYNGAALLPETLTSLCAQTFTDWELVVVDDRSTDDTVAVLRAWPDPRIRVIEASENGGPVRARNLAVSHARGRYLAALDHDDLCRPERFARQVAYLDAHPDVVVVGTAADNLIDGVLSHPDHPPITTPALTEWLLMIGNPLVWSSTMLRGDAVRRLDPFTRPELLYAEDFDLYHRLAPLGRIARLDEVLVAYRIHPGGVSKRFASRMVDGSVAVLEAAHRPLFGDDAGRVAMLFSRHLMLRESVPDRATLAELGAALGRAQAHHLDSREHDADDRRLIRWETARRWARVGRAGLRTGALSVGDLVATRPDHLGLGYAGPGDLLWSRAIGRARTLGAA